MSNELRTSLSRKIPKSLMPGNVGRLQRIATPYWQPVVIDFGMNPKYGPNTRKSASFRVSTDGAFLIKEISRKSSKYGPSGDLAPLQLKITDRQSTRQMNDAPIPLQSIGKTRTPTLLPSPFLVMPSAMLELELTSWLGTEEQYTGSGKFEFVLFGYRVRLEDQDQIASTVFQNS